MNNIKYLISSNYTYYDDFNLSNVCICDTKEKAEELLKELNDNKNNFINLKGKIIYLNSNDVKDIEDVLKDLERYYFQNESNIDKIVYGNKENGIGYKIFLSKKDIKPYLKIFKEYKVYMENESFFDFICSANRDTLITKYCNHSEAILRIEELESF